MKTRKRLSSLFSTQLSEAEKTLRGLEVEYTKQPDGTLVVEGDIDLSDKKLMRLPDLSSVIVKGSFYCNRNKLTSLKGAPKSVGITFHCGANQLTSLEFSPERLDGDFFCYYNRLTSLKYAPVSVAFEVRAVDNPLDSLEHAPRYFQRLTCSFGEFRSWQEIPDHLRLSPQTQARMGEESERARQLELALSDAPVLQREIEVKHPLRLKRREQAGP
jgi:hypothetical protein